MPRFYFHVRSPDHFIRDDEGIELADLECVRREALQGARGLLSEDVRAGRPLDHQQFDVTDQAGNLVLTFPFRDAVNMP